jgi:hypothetical protein
MWLIRRLLRDDINNGIRNRLTLRLGIINSLRKRCLLSLELAIASFFFDLVVATSLIATIVD